MSSANNPQAHSYNFDQVFPASATNRDVYHTVCMPLVEACLRGFNGTLIAYGQTGTGKTTTLSSPDGMIPRALRHLFRRMHRDRYRCTYKVRLSYMQIYQEKIFDLLGDPLDTATPDSPLFSGHDLPLREHPDLGIFVEGLSEHAVRTEAEVHALLARGQQRLVFAETKMNRHSSRSHAICFLTPLFNPDASGASASASAASGDAVVRGRLTLCDLAGSERVKKTNATGTQLSEAKDINLSLLELGNVIQALAEQKKHVPFRNATLTRLLQESLGGNCLTSLIVCVSPTRRDMSETKGTLMFGWRAMRVKTHARINVEIDHEKRANELAEQLALKGMYIFSPIPGSLTHSL
ncbi:P-loop containing nucleoside triphosphate hydrolase protein [Catenaria anguillulae PL171]|uniref:Kinesin-like protein n=1 Tax=Catenaria anguillulae PL171 TaxID=765915 RepID=A0A1Y2HPB9_9FUNG|nr:P-loop containing nucleoside triphosphate hydrolase protein [Catenaria anguillulae PL171]